MIDIPREIRPGYLRTCRILAVLAGVMAAQYVWWLLVDAKPQNAALYWLLVAAEIFNVTQAAGFWVTISMQRWTDPPRLDFARSSETVDVFVTVAGEPVDVVERTVAAAVAIRHPRMRVWVLDDGRDPLVRALSARHGAGYLTRDDSTGAKAGNINHALRMTSGELFAVFDADHVPRPEFLEALVGAFADPAAAFVQTPQVYRNRALNRVASGAHYQQSLFYGPIMRGKNAVGAVFSCGTNVVYRRSAIDEIGGIPEDSITEDLAASMRLIDQGYTSRYVSVVLAEGLGPMDVGSYYNQQLRWARGGLQIMFRRRLPRRMSIAQTFQFGLGFIYWFTGVAYLAYMTLPILFLFFGLRPVQVPNSYPVHFLPYALTALGTIIYASDFDLRFHALWFTLASFPVTVKAIVLTLLGRKASFVTTPKQDSAISLRPVAPLLVAIGLLVVASIYGLVRNGFEPSVVNNVTWAAAHIVILGSFAWLARFPLSRPENAPASVPAPVSAEDGPGNDPLD